MGNKFIERLYDMAATPDNEGLTKLDEQKLKRALNDNKKLLAKNKDAYEREEPRFKRCPRYNPCPICDKCQNKASHLYVSCQHCKIPMCIHTYKDREKMIRRENFKLPVSKETYDLLIKRSEEVLSAYNKSKEVK